MIKSGIPSMLALLISGLFFLTTTYLHAQSDNCPAGQSFDFATDACVSNASGGAGDYNYSDCEGTTNPDGSCNTPTGISGSVTCGEPGSNPATCIPPGGIGSPGQSGVGGAAGGAPGSGGNTGGNSFAPNGNVGGGPAPSGNVSQGGSMTITNPLKSQTISEFLGKIIEVILVFALPIIILYIMYAGFLFVTARGNTEQISTARTALLWSVVGGVIVLGARAILAVIEGTIKAF